MADCPPRPARRVEASRRWRWQVTAVLLLVVLSGWAGRHHATASVVANVRTFAKLYWYVRFFHPSDARHRRLVVELSIRYTARQRWPLCVQEPTPITSARGPFVTLPKPGDWCIFCSYGSSRCPPRQNEGA